MDKLVFNRGICQMLNREIIENLKAMSEKYDVCISTEGGRYDDWTYQILVKFDVVGDHGESGEKRTWDMHAVLAGLRDDDFGKTFRMLNKTYKIVAYAPRRTKRPIVAENMRTGKRFLFMPDAVKTMLVDSGGN